MSRTKPLEQVNMKHQTSQSRSTPKILGEYLLHVLKSTHEALC